MQNRIKLYSYTKIDNKTFYKHMQMLLILKNRPFKRINSQNVTSGLNLNHQV